MIMDYRTTIPEKRIHEISAEVIRRYMPDAGDQDCVELTETFLILGKYMDNFFTDERYVTINCSDMEFRYLGNVATSYKDTLDTWSELISLGTPASVRYNVKPTKTFSGICNDIAVRLGAVMAEISREPIHTLGIDIETYSSEDIANGVYRYADAEDFTILLFAYSVNDGPVLITDIAQGEEIPPRIVEALTDPHVIKTAFNAAFERTCLNKFFGLNMDAEQWECTMVRSAMLGLPLSLDAVGRVLKLEQQKMQEGKSLIRYFSCPCKPTKVNGGRTRNLPQHAPDKWATFKRYCIRDVEVEQAIRRITAAYRIPESEHRLYVADQRINDRGVLVDMDLVTQAIRMDAAYKGRLNAEAVEISGLDNPNSVAQLKAWLEKETDTTVDKLSKKDLPALLASADNDKVERMLRIRQEMAKTSTKKYEAMRKTACSDGRVRGLLQFYGANRTGRWAGRLVQVQNLPQNHLEDLDYARSLVKSGDLSAVELLFGNVPDTLSQLIRTAFIAKDGCTFLVCDFSAIEARVIAWLAGEQWRLEVFRTHGKIYEASASMMFHVPVDEITKTDPRRQKGKIAELALGYQGGVGAMKTMGGESMGLTEEEMSEIVDNWRNANPAIVRLWKDVEAAARMVIRYGEPVSVKGLKFFMSLGAMMIQLPSGRCLSYPRPSVGVNRFGSESICYEGVSQTTKQWCQQETYGGKLVENIVQGIARDCLAITILRLEEKGYPIVFHVHDEVIIEAPENDGVHTLQGVEEIFRMPITWAPGLPLKGAGYTTMYYLKD
jgi:DNA polymerase|nr:MAG TPA: DNA polymerase I [Caudoviricetes sp.]